MPISADLCTNTNPISFTNTIVCTWNFGRFIYIYTHTLILYKCDCIVWLFVVFYN